MKEIIAGFLFLAIFGLVAFTADLGKRQEFPPGKGAVTAANGDANEVIVSYTTGH